MSDNIPLYVSLIPVTWWERCLDDVKSNILTDNPVGTQSFSAYSRNASLVSDISDLIDASGCERLRFLTCEPYQYEFINREHEEYGYKEKFIYTLIDENMSEIIADFDKFFDWCRNNSVEVVSLMNAVDDDSKVIQSIDNAVFTLEPNEDVNQNDNEYYSYLFVFSVLKTTRDLLVEAKKQDHYLVCELWAGPVN